MKARISGSVVLAAALVLAACQAVPPTKPGASSGPKASPGVKASPKGDPRAPVGQRILDARETLVTASLIGKVKLLSDSGASLVSNNSGSLISDAGGTLISDKGLGLVANNSGNIIANNGQNLVANNSAGLIGKTKYGLMQDQGLREAGLTEATVELLDGAGRVLVDVTGKPLTATTDAEGGYKFEGQLPAENLVLRVKVAKAGTLKGGELRALVPNPGGAEVAGTLDVDTPSTLGATYVLEKYVKGRADVYAKLPAKEADALKRDMGAALQKEAAAPAYEAAAIAPAVDALKARDQALGLTLGRIESILLLGQAGLGQGQAATDVPLTMPVAVAYDQAGDLLIGEGYIGRIRRVRAQGGAIDLLAGARGERELQYSVPEIRDMRLGPDGRTYLVEGRRHRVIRLAKAAEPEVVAGTGTEGHQLPVGGDAKATDLDPACLAFGPDGTLYFSERADGAKRTRLLKVDAAGKLGEVPTPESGFGGGTIVGLAIGPDGTFYAAIQDSKTDPATDQPEPSGRVARKRPNEPWGFFHEGLRLGDDADVVWTPTGSLILSEDEGHRLWKLDPASMDKVPYAGTGRSGYAGDGGAATAATLSQPSGLTVAADGRLIFADRGNALVRAVSPAGQISTLAGLHGLFQQGAGSALAVNNPCGLVLDKNGDLLVAEGASHTVKRFDGKALTVVAGTERGDAGDNGPATAAAFDTPAGMAYDAKSGALYLADFKNERLRKIAADGTISTVAGAGARGAARPPSGPATAPAGLDMGRAMYVAIAPDGLPAFTIPNRHQIVKVQADGTLQLLAGVSFQQGEAGKAADSGDGGPALDARMASPQGLVYDALGNLYVCDLGNGRIRKIGLDGKIDTFAGLGTLAWVGSPAANELTTAKDVALALPLSLAIDAQGNLYVGELGTRSLRVLGIEGTDAGVAALLPAAPARIRKIAPDGTVTIVAGPGGKVMTDPEADDALVVPAAILVKPDGSLVVSDPGTNQVRLIPAAATK